MNNASSASATVNVFDVCAKLNATKAGYQLVAGTPVVNGAGDNTFAVANCPAGLASIGGGIVSSGGLNVHINRTKSEPRQLGWLRE